MPAARCGFTAGCAGGTHAVPRRSGGGRPALGMPAEIRTRHFYGRMLILSPWRLIWCDLCGQSAKIRLPLPRINLNRNERLQQRLDGGSRPFRTRQAQAHDDRRTYRTSPRSPASVRRFQIWRRPAFGALPGPSGRAPFGSFGRLRRRAFRGGGSSASLREETLRCAEIRRQACLRP